MFGRNTSARILVLISAVLLVAVGALAGVAVDSALKGYKTSGNVTGSIKSIGSDTMNNEMALWSEGFRKFHPAVKVEVEGKGSSTAPPALIAGTSNFGPMSRKMKSKEIDAFEQQFGYKPIQLRTSIDMLAVYVHKDNPIKGLTLQQIDAVFSKTRKGGYAKDIVTWGDLGLTGEWKNKPISIYGRNSASGTYGYFKKHALFKGDYKDEVKEQPGSSAVVQGVASDKYGIGYSGIGYKTSDVRVVPLSPPTPATTPPSSRPFPRTPTPATTRWPASCTCRSTTSPAASWTPCAASSSSSCSAARARKWSSRTVTSPCRPPWLARNSAPSASIPGTRTD